MKKKNARELFRLREAIYRAFDKTEYQIPNLYDHESIEALDELISLARAHHNLAEHECNGDLTKRQEKRCQAIEARVLKLSALFSLKADFSGDPRGYTVKLHAPTGTMYNTFGGQESGYGIGEN